MITKSLSITCSVILFFALIVVLILMNLSALGAYAVRKVTGGEVEVSTVNYRYDRGRIILTLRDLSLKGTLAGTIKHMDILAGLTSRPFLKGTTISDFDLTIGDLKGKSRFAPLPAELLAIKHGTLTYNQQRLTVNEVRIENLGSSKPFRFTVSVANDSYFQSLQATGEGLYKGKQSDFKGNLRIAGVDLSRLSERMKGKLGIEGPFTYGTQRFFVEGPLAVTGFELKDRVLRKPLTLNTHTGKVTVSSGNGVTDIKIQDIMFRDTPVALNLQFSKNNLTILELTSGFVRVRDVKSYIALDTLVKGSSHLWNTIREGRVKVAKLHYERKKPIRADLELKDMGVTYKDMYFSNIEGLLRVDSDKVTISRGQGVFRSSSFSGAAGTVSLAKDNQVRIKGSYSVDLKDIPSILNVGAVKFRSGTTRGVMEVAGDAKTGYKIFGMGSLEDGDVGWQKVTASVRGSYKFTNDEISLDPLIMTRGGTDMVIRGKWNKKQLGIFMKGKVDVDHLRPLVTVPKETEGTVDLDIALKNNALDWQVDGNIKMDDLFVSIPGFFKKEKGIKAVSQINVATRGKAVEIGHLSFNLDGLDMSLKGTVSPDRTMNMDVAMNIKGFERVAPLFFFEDATPGGDAEVKVAVRDLKWPLTRLPHLTGFARITNGFVKLPWIPKPLQDVDLYSEFRGENFDVQINKLICGQNRLRSGRLRSEGREAPHVSLSLNLDTLDLSDFKSDKEFSIHSISPDSVMAKTRGTFSLRATNATLSNNLSGTNLRLRGEVKDRRLTVSRLTMNTMGGYATINGAVDLAGSVPVVEANGKITGITGGLFVKLMGAKTSVIEGEGIISGTLSAQGEGKQQFMDTLRGNVTVYSRNGVIRKWNLLSKILGLLNVYDLFRGKVPISETGLSYKKLGATARVKDGIFSTRDFLLDSRSMLITGKGDINAKTHTIQGNITVSPLVALDRAIDKIPILRSILREKNRGFLYAAFDVEGPLDDPGLSVSVINTIGGRTIDILKNILVLPKELFEMATPALDGEE